MRDKFRKLAEQLKYENLVDKYADPDIENLPDLDDYLDEWEDQGFDLYFLDKKFLKSDIILFAKTLN